MTKQKLISLLKILATILIIVFSLYFTIRKVDFAELAQSFSNANYWLAIAVFPLVIIGNYIRTIRWKVILQSIHPDVKLGNLFAGVNIGYFMNNIISRSGEIARPYVTAQIEEGTSFSSLLGTIAVERVIDVMALLLVIASVLVFETSLFDGFQDLGVSQAAVKGMLYPAIALGVMVLLIAPSKYGLWIAQTVSKPLPEKFRNKILDIFVKLQSGFGSIKTAKQIFWVAVYTVLLYVVYMLPLYIMFFAFPSVEQAHPVLFDGVKMFVLTALAVAVAPTPGAFGVFHITARIAVMKILNFSSADAVAYATICHFITYITITGLGIYYLLTKNISFKNLMQAKSA